MRLSEPSPNGPRDSAGVNAFERSLLTQDELLLLVAIRRADPSRLMDPDAEPARALLAKLGAARKDYQDREQTGQADAMRQAARAMGINPDTLPSLQGDNDGNESR